MRAVARGDAGALGALSARWQRRLQAFLFRAAGGRDTDDLYQETWLRVVRAAPGFDPRQRFSTWLFQIALNLSRDLLRRRLPEPATAEALARAAVDGSSGAATPGDAALDVQRLLAAPPAAQRAVVVLRVLEDVPEEEVARIVGCPSGTVKSRLHHGLARLAALAREGGAS